MRGFFLSFPWRMKMSSEWRTSRHNDERKGGIRRKTGKGNGRRQRHKNVSQKRSEWCLNYGEVLESCTGLHKLYMSVFMWAMLMSLCNSLFFFICVSVCSVLGTLYSLCVCPCAHLSVCIYQSDCVTNSVGHAGSMADWLLVMNL